MSDRPGGGGHLVVLDLSDLDRLGPIGVLAEQADGVTVVDHHADLGAIPGVHIIDDAASSTGEILFRLASEGEVPVTPDAALCLYVAIMTDTGSFRYANTSAESFRIASELVRIGAIDVGDVGARIFARQTEARIRLRGLVFERARMEDGILWSVVTPDLLAKAGAEAGEGEGIVEELALCGDAEIAALYWTLPDGVIRVQLRAVRSKDVLRIARALGGGGHRRSAGGRVRGATLAEVRRRVHEAASGAGSDA